MTIKRKKHCQILRSPFLGTYAIYVTLTRADIHINDRLWSNLQLYVGYHGHNIRFLLLSVLVDAETLVLLPLPVLYLHSVGYSCTKQHGSPILHIQRSPYMDWAHLRFTSHWRSRKWPFMVVSTIIWWTLQTQCHVLLLSVHGTTQKHIAGH